MTHQQSTPQERSRFFAFGKSLITVYYVNSNCMTDQPLVSVIMPVYNREELIQSSIKSVINQTYKKIELIIVDDCSTDGTPETVKSFSDPRITLIEKNKNEGANTARNSGLAHSSGDYIAFIDSDVIWLPSKINKQVRKLQNSRECVGIVHCGSYTNYGDCLIPSDSKEKGYLFEEIIRGEVRIVTSRLLIKKSCFKNCGHWDEDLPSFNEFDLLLRLAQKYEFGVVEEPLLYELDHKQTSITRNLNSRMEGIEKIVDKWGTKMKELGCENTVEEFRKKKLGYAYQKNAHWHIQNNRRLSAILSFIKYTRFSNSLVKNIQKKDVLLLTSILFGSSFYNKILEFWHCRNGIKKSEVHSDSNMSF